MFKWLKPKRRQQQVHVYLTPPDDIDSEVRLIQEAVGRLTEGDHEVLRLRWGLDRGEPRTITEVAKTMGISESKARELERQAMAKLRGTK